MAAENFLGLVSRGFVKPMHDSGRGARSGGDRGGGAASFREMSNERAGESADESLELIGHWQENRERKTCRHRRAHS